MKKAQNNLIYRIFAPVSHTRLQLIESLTSAHQVKRFQLSTAYYVFIALFNNHCLRPIVQNEYFRQ